MKPNTQKTKSAWSISKGYLCDGPEFYLVSRAIPGRQFKREYFKEKFATREQAEEAIAKAEGGIVMDFNEFDLGPISIGTEYTDRNGRKRKVVDILTTFDSNGVRVKVRYVTEHFLMGQRVIDNDVINVTIQRALAEKGT